MPSRTSAGILMYRRAAAGLEVFLVHPGGPLWAKRDHGSWSIPKGEIEPGEDPRQAAVRELAEETGFSAEGELVPLEPVRQRGGKTILAWAVEGDCDPALLRSNVFEMEWPPRSGRRRSFPEVDRAAWFTLGEARERILAGQAPLLEQLAALRPR